MTTRERAVALAADLTGDVPESPNVQRFASAIEPRIDTMPDADLKRVLIAEAVALVRAAAATARAVEDREAAA